MGMWNPTRFERVVKVLGGTSTSPVHVETEVGEAVLKLLGNPQGPHALAREWVGTRLAQWLGLPTFDMAMIEYTGDPPIEGFSAEKGPAIALRYTHGRPWDGSAEDLQIINPGDVSGLVLLDTWLRNDDRYGPAQGENAPRANVRNVYLADTDDPDRQRLVAMDFTDALRLRRGQSSSLSANLRNIEYYRDPTVFGAFPEFLPYLSGPSLASFLARLGEATTDAMRPIVGEVPAAWEVPDAVRLAIESFLVDRASYLRRSFASNLSEQMSLQSEGCG